MPSKNETKNQRTGRLNKQRSKQVERSWCRAFSSKDKEIRRLDATAGAGKRMSDLRVEAHGKVLDIEVKQRLRPTLGSLFEAAQEKKSDIADFAVLGLEVRKGAEYMKYCIMSRSDFVKLLGITAIDEVPSE